MFCVSLTTGFYLVKVNRPIDNKSDFQSHLFVSLIWGSGTHMSTYSEISGGPKLPIYSRFSISAQAGMFYIVDGQQRRWRFNLFINFFFTKLT